MRVLYNHQKAMAKKRELLGICKKWGVLTHPRTVWETHKAIKDELILREIVQDLAERSITNEQLYADLNITKNS